MATYDLFIDRAESYTFSESSREIGKKNKTQQHQRTDVLKNYFTNYELAKSRAFVYRNRVLDNLDKLLLDFESVFSKRGGKVLWINNEKDAHNELVKIVQKHKAKYVYMGESALADELKLEVGLNKEKITIFSQEPYNIAIAQANFICVEGGIIATANNDLRSYKTLQQADVQIYYVGIESVTQTLAELDFMLQLQSLNMHGESSFEYSNFIAGNDSKLNQETYLMLVDNGRTNILKDNIQKPALTCIHCNTCVNISNVVNNAGIRAYDTIYTGPIGTLLSPKIQTQEDYSHLYFTGILDGDAEKVCPVKIDFTKLTLHNRKAFVKSGLSSKKDNISFYFWKNAMLKRNTMDKGGATFKNFMLRQFFKKSWGNRREFPTAVEKSFNQMWRERKGIK